MGNNKTKEIVIKTSNSMCSFSIYLSSFNPKNPITAPKAIPPKTSVINKVPTSIALIFSNPFSLIPKSVKNTTTPIPSLNNDSPAILVSVIDDKFIFLIIAKTAIGSVGAINEPNKRQSMYERPKVFKPKIGCWISQYIPEPTLKVENSTPKLAKSKIVTLSFNNSWTFTLIAPAKRRNGNITLKSKSLKSNSLVIEVTV